MILLARSCHAAALAEIEALQPLAAGWKKEGFESEILQACAQIYCFFKDHQIVGFLALRSAGGFAEILNVAVAPAKTKQGIASSLLSHALACLKEQNVTQVSLEVAKDNQAAVALYQKAGLVIWGERKDFYGPAKHAFIMGKNL